MATSENADEQLLDDLLLADDRLGKLGDDLLARSLQSLKVGLRLIR
jgi:hypothetical protein